MTEPRLDLDAHFQQVLDEQNARVVELSAENTRLRETLEQIVRHADIPAGESWEQAYIEVTTFAREALNA